MKRGEVPQGDETMIALLEAIRTCIIVCQTLEDCSSSCEIYETAVDAVIERCALEVATPVISQSRATDKLLEKVSHMHKDEKNKLRNLLFILTFAVAFSIDII